jgi:hypothetical protein
MGFWVDRFQYDRLLLQDFGFFPARYYYSIDVIVYHLRLLLQAEELHLNAQVI